jgi:hypothetical protein
LAINAFLTLRAMPILVLSTSLPKIVLLDDRGALKGRVGGIDAGVQHRHGDAGAVELRSRRLHRLDPPRGGQGRRSRNRLSVHGLDQRERHRCGDRQDLRIARQISALRLAERLHRDLDVVDRRPLGRGASRAGGPGTGHSGRDGTQNYVAWVSHLASFVVIQLDVE